MERLTLPLAQTKAFTSFFLDFVQGHTALTPFYGRPAAIDQFEQQAIDKQNSFPEKQRSLLADVLAKQYHAVEMNDRVRANIEALRHPQTFTITTGHQLNVATGPLYFIFKIITVVKACQQLQQQHPQHKFVPVFWMASEDHDYDEIKSFRLFGKKYTWETTQTGAVGRFNPNALAPFLENVPGDTALFQNAYKKHAKLSDAVRDYINTLFGEYGLVVIDGDDHDLKQVLVPVITTDIFQHTAKQLVEQTNTELQQLGYHPQVFARDINFFHLTNEGRYRIERAGEGFRLVDGGRQFTADELRQLIARAPEQFSPNVILRPLYQEMILPNLAYVGGPAEMVYWLQLKRIFQHHHIPFPILLPRNFGMMVDAPTRRKFEKTGLAWRDLFEDKNYLFNHWTLAHASQQLSVGEELRQVQAVYDKLQTRAAAIDVTLAPFVGAHGQRALHSLHAIEGKLLKAEKRKNAEKLRQIEEVKDKLFPGGSLQERADNILNFLPQHPTLLADLVDVFDPFRQDFYILLV